MNKTHKQNLVKLAHFLKTDPRVKDHFDMDSFLTTPGSATAWGATTVERNKHLLKEPTCGTTACALGWASVLFECKAGDFYGLGEELFGLKEYTHEWRWCFAGDWGNTQPSPEEASQRITELVSTVELTEEMKNTIEVAEEASW